MSPSASRLVLVALIGLAHHGCATASGGASATAGRDCGPGGRGGPGPVSFGELVDSAAFVRTFAERWDPAWGPVAAWITRLGESTDTRVLVYARMDTAPRASLQDGLRAHLVGLPVPPEGFSLVLSTNGIFEPHTVWRLNTCPPRPLNVEQVNDALTGLRDRFWNDLLVAPFRTGVSVHVDEDGRVTDTRIHEPSRSADFDAEVEKAARRLRFDPARVEGVPMAVWFGFPMIMTMRKDAPPP